MLKSTEIITVEKMYFNTNISLKLKEKIFHRILEICCEIFY